MKKTLMLFALLILTSCSNVPWSTMFKLRGFDLEDFVALNPDQLKMQVISHDSVALDFERVMIDFKLGTEEKTYEQSIDLNLVSESRKESLIIYELALTEAAQEVLRETQSFMAKHENARVGFSIKTPMPIDENVDTMTLTINMYLANEYLTLLDELVLDAAQFRKSKDND